MFIGREDICVGHVPVARSTSRPLVANVNQIYSSCPLDASIEPLNERDPRSSAAYKRDDYAKNECREQAVPEAFSHRDHTTS